MKNLVLFLCIVLAAINTSAQNVYSTKTGNSTFFSKAPLEDIDAHNDKVGAVLNITTNEVKVVVSIKNFEFKKALMQEHFNDDYLESDKYPDATYNGKINETVDYAKDGVTEVITTGKIKIHNVEKEVTNKGTVTVKNGIITIHSEFYIALKDYNITIPRMVFKNIAENILVKVDCPLKLFVKQ